MLAILAIPALVAVGLIVVVSLIDRTCGSGTAVSEQETAEGGRLVRCTDDLNNESERLFDAEGVLEEEVEVQGGKRHGAYTNYTPGGAIQGTGIYKGGMRTGVWIELFESGARKAATSYQDDLKTGIAQTWHPTGLLKTRGLYEDGKRVGVWEAWSIDGAPSGATVGHQRPLSHTSLPGLVLFAGRPLDWWNSELQRRRHQPKLSENLLRRAKITGLEEAIDGSLQVSPAIAAAYKDSKRDDAEPNP